MPRPKIHHTEDQKAAANRAKSKRYYNKYTASLFQPNWYWSLQEMRHQQCQGSKTSRPTTKIPNNTRKADCQQGQEQEILPKVCSKWTVFQSLVAKRPGNNRHKSTVRVRQSVRHREVQEQYVAIWLYVLSLILLQNLCLSAHCYRPTFEPNRITRLNKGIFTITHWSLRSKVC